MTSIKKVDIEDIKLVAPLFDQYRVFYKQPSNLIAAAKFLEDRISQGQSIIFLAMVDSIPVGFTQLYTTYSSVSLQAVFILNDLFVDHKYRGRGIGEALLNYAKKLCKEMNYKGLALETAVDNPAQQLYEKMGWKKDANCFHYFYTSVERY